MNAQHRFYRFDHYAGRRARMARLRRERIAYQQRLRRRWTREACNAAAFALYPEAGRHQRTTTQGSARAFTKGEARRAA